MHMEQIKALVRLEIARSMADQKRPRNAVVTSVDPDTYSAKVRYEPHDPSDPDNGESGWIPVQAMATGAGFGMFSVPNIGDPVEVNFQGGDHETGRITQRNVSEQFQPPSGMKPGEHWVVHGTGSVFALKADGSVFMGGAGTQKVRQGKDPATGQDGQKPIPQQPQGLQGITLSPDGKLSINTPLGNFSTTAGKDLITQVTGQMQHAAQTMQHTAQTIQHSAAGKIISQAGKILLNCG